MAIEYKPNFFSKQAASAPSLASQIAWANDPKFRAEFGGWLYDNFSDLVAEYKKHGRFLTLQELSENPLE
jgi:hypothetical protein